MIPCKSSASWQGCCSHHGGITYICSDNGHMICRDGTLSPSCLCDNAPLQRKPSHSYTPPPQTYNFSSPPNSSYSKNSSYRRHTNPSYRIHSKKSYPSNARKPSIHSNTSYNETKRSYKNNSNSYKYSDNKKRVVTKYNNNKSDLYKKGLSFYNNKNYSEAINIFDTLISSYPNSNEAQKALFWKADCFFQMKNYGQAALAFQKVIEGPTYGYHIEGAYLKQAMCFMVLDKIAAATKRFNDLIWLYPNTREAVRARQIIYQYGL